jgi:hypothetical protein
MGRHIELYFAVLIAVVVVGERPVPSRRADHPCRSRPRSRLNSVLRRARRLPTTMMRWIAIGHHRGSLIAPPGISEPTSSLDTPDMLAHKPF